MRSRLVLWGRDFYKLIVGGSLIVCASLLAGTRAQTVTPGAFPASADIQTGYFLQFGSIANNTGTNLPGLRVLVRDIPADTPTNAIRVANAHGLTNLTTTITNVPFFDFGPVTAGQTVPFVVEWYIANRTTKPSPTFEAIVMATPAFVLPTTILVTNNATRVVDGKFFAEFKSLEGSAYYIQYNSSLTASNGWKTSLPPVRGSGATVQWVDTGPPRTESVPLATTQRFYRVVVVPE